MTIFGLNSPEIFIVFLITLFILGPKRIEKLLNAFPGFIKFLLNDEKNYNVILEKKEEEAPVLEKKEEEAPVLEKREEEAPVLEKKEEEARVLEKREEKASNDLDKVTNTMKVIPTNLEGDQMVNSKKSVKNIENTIKVKQKSLKKEKTSKPKKEIKTMKDKDLDNTKKTS